MLESENLLVLPVLVLVVLVHHVPQLPELLAHVALEILDVVDKTGQARNNLILQKLLVHQNDVCN